MYVNNILYLPFPSIDIGPPKQDKKQSIKNKNIRSLSFHFDLFSGCPFVRLSVFPDFRLYLTNYSIKRIYICSSSERAHEEIKIMCFICRFNVYLSRNQRKCSQNGEDENFQF